MLQSASVPSRRFPLWPPCTRLTPPPRPPPLCALQVRAILADVEDRLRDWSPAALGTKAPMSGDTSGAPSCLCCDTRVRAVRDLRAMGFKDDDRCGLLLRMRLRRQAALGGGGPLGLPITGCTTLGITRASP